MCVCVWAVFADAAHTDPMMEDFLAATEGGNPIINFSTIPQWMWQTDEPVAWPNYTLPMWNYEQGNRRTCLVCSASFWRACCVCVHVYVRASISVACVIVQGLIAVQCATRVARTWPITTRAYCLGAALLCDTQHTHMHTHTHIYDTYTAYARTHTRTPNTPLGTRRAASPTSLVATTSQATITRSITGRSSMRWSMSTL